MPSVRKKQQKYMGMVNEAKKGRKAASQAVSKATKSTKSFTKKLTKKFNDIKTKGFSIRVCKKKK